MRPRATEGSSLYSCPCIRIARCTARRGSASPSLERSAGSSPSTLPADARRPLCATIGRAASTASFTTLLECNCAKCITIVYCIRMAGTRVKRPRKTTKAKQTINRMICGSWFVVPRAEDVRLAKVHDDGEIDGRAKHRKL